MQESASTALAVVVESMAVTPATAPAAALRPKLARRCSRNASSTSPPPPLPLISLSLDDELEEFDTPTRSGFHYELPHVDLADEEFEDTSVPSHTASATAAGGGRRRREPASDHERVKVCRLLSAYMTQNESFQTQRHGFGIDTRLVYKRNKGADIPASTATGSGGAGSADDLAFSALFESGNLDRAYRVNGRHYASSSELLGAAPAPLQPPPASVVKADLEYDLYCDPDVNTHGHIQWYFFRAALPTTARPQSAGGRLRVRFNIRNMLKRASLYNDGMLPAVYVESPSARRRGWHHAGTNVCYFKNADTYRNSKTGKVHSYYTLSFVYEFNVSGAGAGTGATDPTRSTPPAAVVYFAHCYPYTYTRLQRFLLALQRDPERSPHLKRRVLCKTIAGNNCDVVTITDFSQEDSPEQAYAAKRSGVFLTARVHPGESNSSFVMHGILDFLTGGSLEACFLRRHFVFKVVPMLNPDGVVHGNYRCSLAGTDLNRRWMHPSAELHPTILATKNAIVSMKTTRPVSLYCDLHGHSRRKNIFLYGCKPFEPSSRAQAARLRLFPHLLAKTSSAQRGGFYSLSDCTFSVSSSKKGTGRVVVWKELEVLHSFTLETSFFGVGCNKQQQQQQQLDQLAAGDRGAGASASLRHFTAFDLRTAGAKFCTALLPFAQWFCEQRVALPEFASSEAPSPSFSSMPNGFTSPEFDELFTGDNMTALLSLSDPEDLLKEIEAALPDALADCVEEDTSVGSESDLSGDNMEDEELQSAATWRNILPLPVELPIVEPVARPLRARPPRLMRHLSEPRLHQALVLKELEAAAAPNQIEAKAEPLPSAPATAAPLAPLRVPSKVPLRVPSLRSLPNDRNRDIAALHLRAVQRRSKTRRELQQPVYAVMEF